MTEIPAPVSKRTFSGLPPASIFSMHRPISRKFEGTFCQFPPSMAPAGKMASTWKSKTMGLANISRAPNLAPHSKGKGFWGSETRASTFLNTSPINSTFTETTSLSSLPKALRTLIFPVRGSPSANRGVTVRALAPVSRWARVSLPFTLAGANMSRLWMVR